MDVHVSMYTGMRMGMRMGMRIVIRTDVHRNAHKYACGHACIRAARTPCMDRINERPCICACMSDARVHRMNSPCRLARVPRIVRRTKSDLENAARGLRRSLRTLSVHSSTMRRWVCGVDISRSWSHCGRDYVRACACVRMCACVYFLRSSITRPPLLTHSSPQA